MKIKVAKEDFKAGVADLTLALSAKNISEINDVQSLAQKMVELESMCAFLIAIVLSLGEKLEFADGGDVIPQNVLNALNEINY